MSLKDAPTCPACGHAETDAWELDFGAGLEGDTHVWCGECETEYRCARTVSVYYRSSPLKGAAT